MWNEKEIQKRLNRRLSGLDANELRRMRIRVAIDAQRQEEYPVKKKFSAALVFAMAAMLLMASIALAEHWNLFHFFGKQEERYAAVAPYASLTVEEPVLAEHPHLGHVKAAIDSAYFDGASLMVAYKIENPTHVEAFTPTPEELAAMTKYGPNRVAVEEGSPGAEVYQAYNQAVEQGRPYGYRQYTVYPSDHTFAQETIDLGPPATLETYDEAGAYCELREFELPLPNELASLDEVSLSIAVYQQETLNWYDGTYTYTLDRREKIGTMQAMIPAAQQSANMEE